MASGNPRRLVLGLFGAVAILAAGIVIGVALRHSGDAGSFEELVGAASGRMRPE